MQMAFRILTENRPGVEGGIRLSYATLGAFIKYPKESLPHKPTKNIGDKKFGIFQSEKEIFQEVAEELGLIKVRNDKNVAFTRHPLAFLVEAADDICYTIIDFEDGINLGLIDEDFALEYLNQFGEKQHQYFKISFAYLHCRQVELFESACYKYAYY